MKTARLHRILVAACFIGVASVGVADERAIDWLSSEAKRWISADQNIPDTTIDVKTPDRRARIVPCESDIAFRWPFASNFRTLEASCEIPQWRYFLQVNLKEVQPVVVAQADLARGVILNRNNVDLAAISQANEAHITEIQDVLGATLLTSIAAGSPFTRDQLEFYETQFMTLRAYAPGDVIDLADLSIESALATDQDTLKQWPRGQVIATRQLEAGHSLTADDVEAAITVVVAKENIIRNQVITPDLVTVEVIGGVALGAKPMTDLDAVIGFEATRTIQAGSTLNPSDLRAADLIREGENVTLTIQKGALSITVDTIATEDAKMAEQVILINPESGREIRGIVTGRNRARGL